MLPISHRETAMLDQLQGEVTAPASLTHSEIGTVLTTAAAWPWSRWLTADIVWSFNGPGKQGLYNYASLTPAEGPSFGSGFLLGRENEGYGVSYLWADGESPEEWGPYATVDEALQEIDSFIREKITGWGLAIAA